MPLDPLADRLERLVEQGSIRESELSAPMVRRLRTLFDVGAIERVRSGAGARLVCKAPDALRAWVARHYPSGLEGVDATGLPPRARAVANFADAKRAGIADKSAILIRGFTRAVFSAGDDTLDAKDLTDRFGLCALARPDGRRWRFAGHIAIVENLEVFLHAEKLVPDLEAAAWATSVVSGRVLAWLGELAASGASILHMGDYDPVGLSHFLKVRETCGQRATFFSPPDLEERIRRWGKAELISASAGIFDRLRRAEDPSVSKVVDIIERLTKGLEHEALLLPLTGTARHNGG